MFSTVLSVTQKLSARSIVDKPILSFIRTRGNPSSIDFLWVEGRVIVVLSRSSSPSVNDPGFSCCNIPVNQYFSL